MTKYTDRLQSKLDELAGRKLRLGTITFEDIEEVMGSEIDSLSLSDVAGLLRGNTLKVNSKHDEELDKDETDDIKSVIYEMLEDNDPILMELLSDKIKEIISINELLETDSNEKTHDNNDTVEFDSSEQVIDAMSAFFGDTTDEEPKNAESLDEFFGTDEEPSDTELLVKILNDDNKLKEFIEKVGTNTKSDDAEINMLIAIAEDDEKREELINKLASMNIQLEAEEHFEDSSTTGVEFMLASNISDVLSLNIKRQDTEEPIISLLANRNKDKSTNNDDELLPLFFNSAELMIESLNKSGQIMDIISKSYYNIERANSVVKIINQLDYDNKVGLVMELFQSYLDHAGYTICDPECDPEMQKQINKVYTKFTGKQASYCRSNYLSEIVVNGFRSYLMLALLKSKNQLDKISHYTDYVIINRDKEWTKDRDISADIDTRENVSDEFLYLGLKNMLDDNYELHTNDCITILQFLKDDSNYIEQLGQLNYLEAFAITLLAACEEVNQFI